jgi:hypothetical protein
LFDEILRSEKEKLRDKEESQKEKEEEGTTRREKNARSVGETESELVQRRDVLRIEPAVVDERPFGKVRRWVERDGAVVVGVRVVVVDAGGDGEGQLPARTDVAEENGGDGGTTFSRREVGVENGGNVLVIDPLAEIDGTGCGDDDNGVVVARGDVVDEFVAAIAELCEENKSVKRKGKREKGRRKGSELKGPCGRSPPSRL